MWRVRKNLVVNHLGDMATWRQTTTGQ